MWIGYKKRPETNSFLDYEGKRAGYINWGTKQPDNYGGNQSKLFNFDID